jgi:hypothetical protein
MPATLATGGPNANSAAGLVDGLSSTTDPQKLPPNVTPRVPTPKRTVVSSPRSKTALTFAVDPTVGRPLAGLGRTT